MIPKTLSASAITAAEGCLARWLGEYSEQGRGIGRGFTMVGSACHDALEPYVRAVYIDKTKAPNFDYLKSLFEISYMKVFNSTDFKTAEFKDGLSLLKKWFERTDLSTVTVLEVENKKRFPLKTSIGEIPFTYILDRLDMLEPGVYRVVDYKTNSFPLSPSELREKIQARVYAMTVMMHFPDAKRIWVEFDMLRHDGPVGTVFDREDCVETWHYLKSVAERIIAIPEDPAKRDMRELETLNTECHFCVRKTTCGAFKNNINAGGVFSVTTAELVDRRAELSYAKKMIESAIKEMDEVILGDARMTDTQRFEGVENDLVVTSRSVRAIDPDLALRVIGPELFQKFGKSTITIGNVERLMDGEELTPEQKKDLSGLIYSQSGAPYLAPRKRKPPAAPRGATKR